MDCAGLFVVAGKPFRNIAPRCHRGSSLFVQSTVISAVLGFGYRVAPMLALECADDDLMEQVLRGVEVVF